MPRFHAALLAWWFLCALTVMLPAAAQVTSAVQRMPGPGPVANVPPVSILCATSAADGAPLAPCSFGGGGGGAGGAVTAGVGGYVDGALVNLGSLADSAYSGSGNASLTSIEKGIYARLGTLLQAGGLIGNTGFNDNTLAPAISGNKVQTSNAAPTGAVTDFGGTAVTASAMLVSAASAYRLRAIVFNNTASGGGALYCRADGGAAASGVGIVIPPGGGAYEWDYPQAGTAAINCACSTGTCTVGGEYVQ